MTGAAGGMTQGGFTRPPSGAGLRAKVTSGWRLEETAGATRNDSFAGNHLTDHNTVGQAAGVVGNCADFTAASAHWLSRASNTSLQGGDKDFGFYFFFKLKSVSQNHTVLAKENGGSGGGNREYRVVIAQGEVPKNIQFHLWDSTDSYLTFLDWQIDLNAGQWYFGSFWHDASAKTVYGELDVYGQIYSETYVGTAQTTNTDFTLGANANGQDNMDGYLDQVYFFNGYFLTHEERLWLRNYGAGRDVLEFT